MIETQLFAKLVHIRAAFIGGCSPGCEPEVKALLRDEVKCAGILAYGCVHADFDNLRSRDHQGRFAARGSERQDAILSYEERAAGWIDIAIAAAIPKTE